MPDIAKYDPLAAHVVGTFDRSNVIKQCLELLYAQSLKHSEAAALSLIEHNNALLRRDYRGFYYKEWTITKQSARYDNILPLREELYDAITPLYQLAEQEYLSERRSVQNYLTKALSCCNFQEEFYLVLPAVFHQVVKDRLGIDNVAHPQSLQWAADSGAYFKARYETVKAAFPDMEQIIKQRMVLNVLLGR